MEPRDPAAIAAERMALAWGLAFLTPLAVMLTTGPRGDAPVFANPEKAAAAFAARKMLGYLVEIGCWAVAIAATSRYLRRAFGADSRVVMRSVVGWSLGWITAMPLASLWMHSSEAGFFAPIVGMGLAGAIGGAMTLPVSTLSIPAVTQARIMAVSGLGLGGAFLCFAFLGFVAGYILVAALPDEIAGLAVGPWGMILALVAPACAAGFAAARIGQQVFIHTSQYQASGLFGRS